MQDETDVTTSSMHSKEDPLKEGINLKEKLLFRRTRTPPPQEHKYQGHCQAHNEQDHLLYSLWTGSLRNQALLSTLRLEL